MKTKVSTLTLILFAVIMFCSCSKGHDELQADEAGVHFYKTETTEQLVDSLLDRADRYYAESDYQQCLELIQQALPIVRDENIDNERRSFCYNLTSIAYFRLGDFEQAIEYAEKTLAIDQAEDNPDNIASSLNTMAGIYLGAEQPENALHYILEAIEIERTLDDKEHLSIRLGLASEIYVKLNRNEEARQTAQEALDLALPLGNKSIIGIRQSQLAAAYLALGEQKKAEDLLDEAIANLRAANNQNSLAITLNQQGSIAAASGNRAKAIACFTESAAICRETGNSMIEAKASQQAATLIRETDAASAYNLMERYAKLNQQLYSEQSAQALANFEARYETAKKQHQVEMLQEELKLHYVWTIALCILLVAAALVIMQMRRIALLRTKNEHMLVRSNILGIAELGELPDIKFTKRELEVIAYCARGLIAKEVADRMGISERTVNTHKNNIFKKLGVQNTVELVIYAKKAGIVPDDNA